MTMMRTVTNQWRRPVVKYGGQGQSDYTLCQWFPNTQQSRFLAACRRLIKIIFTFDTIQVDYMQPGWCQPVRQEFMENECEALPGVAYPGVQDNRSTLNTKTGYDDSIFETSLSSLIMWNLHIVIQQRFWMKECHMGGGQNTLHPSHIFSWVQDP